MKGSPFVACALLAFGCATVKPSPEALRNSQLCEQDFLATSGPNSAAEVECGWAVQLYPADARSWATQGLLLLRRGERDQAKRSLETALQHAPNLDRAVLGLGVIAFWDRHFLEAVKLFAQVSAQNALDVDARYNLALTQYFARDIVQANKVLSELTSRWPTLPHPWQLLAALRLDDDYPDQALRLCRRALDADATVPAEWALLGVAYERLSRRDDAEYAFRSCLDISPGDSDCRQDLELLNRGEPLLPPRVAPLRF